VWHSRGNILKPFVSAIVVTALVVPNWALPCPVCVAYTAVALSQSPENEDTGCCCSCSQKGRACANASGTDAGWGVEDSSHDRPDCPRDCGPNCIAPCCSAKTNCQSAPELDFDFQPREGGLTYDHRSARPASATPNGILRPPRD